MLEIMIMLTFIFVATGLVMQYLAIKKLKEETRCWEKTVERLVAQYHKEVNSEKNRPAVEWIAPGFIKNGFDKPIPGMGSLPSIELDPFLFESVQSVLERESEPCTTMGKRRTLSRIKNFCKRAPLHYMGDIICDKSLSEKNLPFGKIMRAKFIGPDSFDILMKILRKHGYDKPIKCDEYWKIRDSKDNVHTLRTGG